MCRILQNIISLFFLPPFCTMKLTMCGCWVRCKAVRNLSHWSDDFRRSSKAAVRLYTVLSLRTSANSGRVRTSSLINSSSKPKSGSTMFVRADFSLTMFSKMLGTSSGNTTYYYSKTRYIATWVSCKNAIWWLSCTSRPNFALFKFSAACKK